MDCFIANDEILKGEKMVEDYKFSVCVYVCACVCGTVMMITKRQTGIA